ncbi:ABZJ_00895 family protein [Aestuariivita boseongensis]|uniref:ABZJ_00895 family protein n=1 Tax=Aestuariivita boseongensis TaxID=1470562 RepID=UPI000680EFE3|nr:ABZJ_00895 family protein [Aestuariivita boseongensis]
MEQSGYIRFAAWYVGVSIGLPIFLMILLQLTGLDLRSAFSFVFPMMISAVMAGTHYARRMGRVPTSGEAWAISVRLMALGFALSVGIILALFPVTGSLIPTLSPLTWAGVAAFVLLVFLALARVFFALGAKNHIDKGASRG